MVKKDQKGIGKEQKGMVKKDQKSKLSFFSLRVKFEVVFCSFVLKKFQKINTVDPPEYKIK